MEKELNGMDNYLSGLATEHVNEETRNLDRCSTLDMVDMINRQDAKVADAVAQEKKQIARAVDLICAGLEKGGHLYYLGAGTSGRLGVLDASECVPTFGVSPELVQGFIAGGDTALRNAVEGAEDDAEAGAALVDSLNAGEHDTVVGISASGSAPFVRGALVRARERGCVTVGLCTNKPNKLEALCDVTIAPEVGPEVVSGSTRMKSGTAQKMVLNMLSTCSMVKLGKVYGNLMVDLRASNVKLRDRAVRLVRHATGVEADAAQAALDQADGHVKLAILMIKTGMDAQTAKLALEKSGGHLCEAIEAAGGKNE